MLHVGNSPSKWNLEENAQHSTQVYTDTPGKIQNTMET